MSHDEQGVWQLSWLLSPRLARHWAYHGCRGSDNAVAVVMHAAVRFILRKLAIVDGGAKGGVEIVIHHNGLDALRTRILHSMNAKVKSSEETLGITMRQDPILDGRKGGHSLCRFCH